MPIGTEPYGRRRLDALFRCDLDELRGLAARCRRMADRQGRPETESLRQVEEILDRLQVLAAAEKGGPS